MVAIAYSGAFEGVEARLVEVQCAVAADLPAFSIVGLPDKAVSEARERVRAAFRALSMALLQNSPFKVSSPYPTNLMPRA